MKMRDLIEGMETLPTGELLEAKLSKEQIDVLKKETVKNGVPVRFLVGGAAIDIITGETFKKGMNVMYQPVYWNFTKETAKKVAEMLGAKAVFSEDVTPVGVELNESDASEMLADILGRDFSRKLRAATGGDEQARKLAVDVYMELAKRLSTVVDRDFVAAMNRLRNATRLKDDGARNMIFKAANELGMKLPSMMF